MFQSRLLSARHSAPLWQTCCLAFVIGTAGPAVARSGADEALLCVRAAESAARETGVPLRLLLALTLTETGRQSGGTHQPWPWALNQGGDSHWLPTRQAALDHLTNALAEGITNIDVGCFQLNYRWHGDAFSSLDQMMDPEANALYAARLVAGHAEDLGDWIAAAGAYHSSTPDKAEIYLARFEPIYAALGNGPQLAPPGDEPAPRANGYPLLMAGGAASGGSIVPRIASRRALIGGS